MTFSSVTFLVFFTIILTILSITNNTCVKKMLKNRLFQFRHVILLFASYIFYGWWDWRFCILMFGVSLTAYFAGIRKSKNMTIAAVTIVLSVLGIFKYYNFFVSSFCALFSIKHNGLLNIILPVGISFYTFQAISYIIDVYRNDVEAESSFINVALYISFFPQLVAGPIVKSSDFMHQLKEDRNVSLHNIEQGIQIFIFGLFKKIVLADNLSVYVDEVYENPNAFSSATIILAVISYSMQIYFDFSGYSDMAIGSAKCLGYDLSKNFNMPYISRNVTEFWKRWHISLSNWLKQYLYIPLGGNRKGEIRTYINLLITMTLGGLWHGADWTFVLWGFVHGLALCIHKLWMKSALKTLGTHKITKIISCMLTFIFVTLCWVLFRAENIENAMQIYKGIFIMRDGITHIFSYAIWAILTVVVFQFAAYIKSKRNNTAPLNGSHIILDLTKISSLIILFVAIGLTIGLAYTGANPFIYFQF